MNEVTSATEPSAKSTVSVSATFNILGQEVSVTSQDINKIRKDGFKFELANAITLGTIPDLLKWINEQFKTNIPVDEIETTIKGLPIVGTALYDLWTLSLTIEVLKIDTGTGLFEIAIMLEPSVPPDPILGVLTIEKLGIGVTRISAPQLPPAQ